MNKSYWSFFTRFDNENSAHKLAREEFNTSFNRQSDELRDWLFSSLHFKIGGIPFVSLHLIDRLCNTKALNKSGISTNV